MIFQAPVLGLLSLLNFIYLYLYVFCLVLQIRKSSPHLRPHVRWGLKGLKKMKSSLTSILYFYADQAI